LCTLDHEVRAWLQTILTYIHHVILFELGCTLARDEFIVANTLA
jgi:hypothetical protein